MQHEIKKIFKALCLVFIAVLMLASCEQPTDQDDEELEPIEITQEMLEELKFENKTLGYNGKPQGIYIDNIYEKYGVTVEYSGNEKTRPGQYAVSAEISYPGLESVYKRAILTIEKGESLLEMETNHTVNIVSGKVELPYTSNSGDEQELVIKNKGGHEIELTDLIVSGVYELDAYLGENSYYKESNHVAIVVTVITSAFNIKFESKEVIADGNVHTLEISGTVPEGYSVEYENNSGSEDGKYYAVANVVNKEGDVVETHRAVLTIENPEHEGFKQYLDEFFVEYLEGDQLSVNIFCENPFDFGLEHYEASWYTFSSFGDEEIASDLQLFKDLLAELEVFKDVPLNDLQETAYETIEKFLEYNIEYYSIGDSFFMGITYVDQFGGYVADFGTYMESYSLRSEVEVQDIVSYIESTKTAFPSYLDFLAVKVEKGYALSNFTLTEMRNYLKDVLDQGSDYYLKDIIYMKIDAVDFLDEEQKATYKAQVEAAITDCFVVGVQELYDGLETYLDKLPEDGEGYLTKYENGQEVYLLELKNKLGVDEIDVEEYIAEIDEALRESVDKVIDAQQKIVQMYGISTYSELEKIVADAAIYKGTPDEMLVYLKEFAKAIVPDLKSNPEIVVKEMDEASAKVSNAVAYYMKSALDNTGAEYITLNPVQLQLSTSNDVLGTLAHEGYPGHLYAYVYSKELGLSNVATVMTNVGHAEGWATYVQLKLYEYAKSNSTNNKFNIVMDYLYANQLSGYLLETRLDAGVHLEGWGVDEIAKYMSGLGYSSDSAESIYDLLIEIPTQYVSYGYGKLVFVNLHEEAKEILGIYYDEVEFNAMLLSKGWTDLGILQETYHEYMKDKCFQLGIDFE